MLRTVKPTKRGIRALGTSMLRGSVMAHTQISSSIVPTTCGRRREFAFKEGILVLMKELQSGGMGLFAVAIICQDRECFFAYFSEGIGV